MFAATTLRDLNRSVSPGEADAPATRVGKQIDITRYLDDLVEGVRDPYEADDLHYGFRGRLRAMLYL